MRILQEARSRETNTKEERRWTRGWRDKRLSHNPDVRRIADSKRFVYVTLCHDINPPWIGPPNIGGEVTPGGGGKCSDAKICGPGKVSGPEPTCRRKAKICSDVGSKIRIFSGPRSREGRIFRDIFCGVIISIPSRVKIRAQHVLGLQYVFPLHKFPMDYDPPHPECTDNSTDLMGILGQNLFGLLNQPHPLYSGVLDESAMETIGPSHT